MKTLNAVWSFDCRRYVTRSIVLVAAVIAFDSGGLLGVGAAHVTVFMFLKMALMMGGFLVAPLLFMGSAIEVGRSGSPREFRLFIHTLPVDRSEVAVAKLLYAFVWVEALPVFVASSGIVITNLIRGIPVRLDYAGAIPAMLVLTAAMFWVMLISALFPHRAVLVGVPVFVLGEALARNVTGIQSLAINAPHSILARWTDGGLLGIQIFLICTIFVLYYTYRSRRWTLLAGLLALGGTDGLRALFNWLLRANG